MAKQNINLSLDDMWKLTNNQVDIGIEGYNVPNLCKIPKKVKAIFIKTDEETGKPILPKRPNFLDEVYKWANSYYDKEKAEKVIEELEGKGRSLDGKPKSKEEVPIKYPNRKFFTDELIREEKRKYEYLEEKLEIIDTIKEKTKEWQDKQLPFLESMKVKYFPKNAEGMEKGSLPKATRITVVADAEHVGEKYPFYNTYIKPDEEETNKKKLFYPDKKSTLPKAPAWNFQNHNKKEEEIEKEQARKELEKEQIENVTEKVKDKQKLKDYDLKVRDAFETVKNKGNRHFTYTLRKRKEDEQEVWDRYLEQNPKKHVGPQHYWQYPKLGYKIRPDYKPPTEDDAGQKVYFMKRETTDKKIYKPMKKHIF